MNRLSRQLCDAVSTNLSGQKARPPEAGRDLWNAFQRLSATRTYHAGGPNPVQPSEVLAWCQLTRQPLDPGHVEIIFAMDRAWLERAYSGAKVRDGVKTLPPISAHPLSAGLLDAIMG